MSDVVEKQPLTEDYLKKMDLTGAQPITLVPHSYICWIIHFFESRLPEIR
mgnify:CR=1 FL=1